MNLSRASVREWLAGEAPPCVAVADEGAPDVVSADDYPTVASRLLRLGEAIEQAAPEAFAHPDVVAALQALLPQLRAGRRLRLLDHLAGVEMPPSRGPVAAVLLDADAPAAPPGSAAFLRAWLAGVEREAIRARILDPARVATLEALCGEAGGRP